MRYETTPAFAGDVRRLSASEAELFRSVVRTRFVPAAERLATEPGSGWPRSLRVRAVVAAPGIWEMTWSCPNGRATFEWVAIGGEPAIRWRRVGGDGIFADP